METSIVVERVATQDVATLFEQYGTNGFIEEGIDEKVLKITFFIEIDDEQAHSHEDIMGKLIGEVEATLKDHSIATYGPTEGRMVGEEDWISGWKEFAQPIELVPNFVLVPQWITYEGREGQSLNYYNSDFSFGTGAHATTASCAKLIALYGKESEAILDVGTGTGVLLLVSHYVNPKATLYGIDIDRSSVKQAMENCNLNNVPATIIEGNLDNDFEGLCDLIVANLTVDPLKILLGQIKQKLRKNGILIISGIIDERYYELKPYIESHWSIVEHIHLDGWNTFALKHRG